MSDALNTLAMRSIRTLGQSLNVLFALAAGGSSVVAQSLPEIPIPAGNINLKDIDLLFPQRPAAGSQRESVAVQWRGELVNQEGPLLTLVNGLLEVEGTGGNTVVLRAESISFNHLDQSIKASGNVVLEHPHYKMSCQQLELRLTVSGENAIRTGEALGAIFELPPSWILAARRVRFEDYPGDTLGILGKLLGGGKADRTTEFRFEDASVSPCPDERPNWVANASMIHLKTGSYGNSSGQGYATLNNIVLRIGPAPIMWLPWVLFPARVDRAPGLLPPEFGYSGQLGAIVGMSYFQPLGDAADATISPTWHSKVGTMWAFESRWEPGITHKGNFSARYIRPKDTGEARYRFGLQEIWDLENGWFVRADINSASDQLMDTEFGKSAPVPIGTPAYDSTLFVGKNFKWAALSLFASDNRSFFQPDDPFYNYNFPASLQKIKMPEGQLRFFPVPIGNFYLDGSSRIGQFGYYLDLGEDSPMSNYTWERSDHQIRLQGHLGRWGPLRADLQLGARFTHYSAVISDPFSDAEEDLGEEMVPTNPIDDPAFDPFRVEGPSAQRWVGSSRLLFSAPQIGRSFLNLNLAGYNGDIKHILEPSIAFSFNSRSSLAGVFPRFDEADTRPGVGNTVVGERSVEFGLKQHLFGRPDSSQSYADLLRARIAVKYYVDPIIYYDGREKQGWASLNTYVDIEPTRAIKLSFKRATEVSNGESDSSLSADVAVSKTTKFSLAAFSSGKNQLRIRQRGIRAGGTQNIWGDKLGLQFEANYDFVRKTFTQSQVALIFGSPCVAFSLSYYHIYLPEISRYRKEDRISFSLNLKNLGELFSVEFGNLFRSK